MPRLYNWEPYPVVPNIHALAVLPGETYDFTDEQVANGITGRWSTEDPRQPGATQQPALAQLRRITAALEAANARNRPG